MAFDIEFFENAREQFEKLSLLFSSCSPFPSWSSEAKYTCSLFQCTNIVIVLKNGPLFLRFHRPKHIFLLLKGVLKIRDYSMSARWI